MTDEVDHLARRVGEYTFLHDRLMGLLGARVLGVAPGYARVALTVEERHLNAAGVCHEGALFSLCDFAFAIAGNSHGRLGFAIEVNISFFRSANLKDELIAEAKEIHMGKRIGLYSMEVTNQEGERIALAKGVSYHFDKPFPPIIQGHT